MKTFIKFPFSFSEHGHVLFFFFILLSCHFQFTAFPNNFFRSHLTSNEQASVIWGLAEYIITLSPRERGDVMKILNPDVKLSHINALTLVGKYFYIY